VKATPVPPPRLLDRMRVATRLRHYSIRTEDAHADWVRRFIVFHGKRHPATLGAAEIVAFLIHLAVDRCVALRRTTRASRPFLYRVVLEQDLPWLDEVSAARAPRRLPVGLTPAEVRALLQGLKGTMGLLASLLYGTGLRLLEGLRLRVNQGCGFRAARDPRARWQGRQGPSHGVARVRT
jgi:integrase